MQEFFKPYADPLVLLPIAAMFVIVFAVVLTSLKRANFFPHGTSVVVAICVSVLAMYGVDRTVVRLIVIPYTGMGIAMLVSLAVLLLAMWLTILFRATKRVAPPRREDHDIR